MNPLILELETRLLSVSELDDLEKRKRRLLPHAYETSDWHKLISGYRSIHTRPASLEEALKGWRPIETVPKDGTRIKILVVHANAQYSADPEKDGWVAECEAYWTDFNTGGLVWDGLCGVPTKWKPIPNEKIYVLPPMEMSDAVAEWCGDNNVIEDEYARLREITAVPPQP